MAKLLGFACLLVAMSCVTGQFGGRIGGGARNGQSAFARSRDQTALQAAQQQALLDDNQVAARNQQQAEVDALQQAQQQQNAGVRANDGQQVGARTKAIAENFGDAKVFLNLDVKAKDSGIRRTDIAVNDQNLRNTGAAINFNDGRSVAVGDRAALSEDVAAQQFANADTFFNRDDFARNRFGLGLFNDQALNIGQRAAASDQNVVNALNRRNTAAGVQSDFGFDSDFFSGGGFGAFRKRRRR